jgi:hypothetical protein
MARKCPYTSETLLKVSEDLLDVEIIQWRKLTGTWRHGACHQSVFDINGILWAVNSRSQPQMGMVEWDEPYEVKAKVRPVIIYLPKLDESLESEESEHD